MVMHSVVVGEPQSSLSVTQYTVPELSGSTVMLEPLPIGMPFSVQVKVYAVEPPAPAALRTIFDSEQIMVSAVRKVMSSGFGCPIVTPIVCTQPFASVTVQVLRPAGRSRAAAAKDEEISQS